MADPYATQGDLSRHFAQKIGNVLITHWTPRANREAILFSQPGQSSIYREHKAHTWDLPRNERAWPALHEGFLWAQPPAGFLHLFTVNSSHNRNKVWKTPSHFADKTPAIHCQSLAQRPHGTCHNHGSVSHKAQASLSMTTCLLHEDLVPTTSQSWHCPQCWTETHPWSQLGRWSISDNAGRKMTRLFFLIFYNINCLEFLPGKFFHLFLAFSYDKALKPHLEANVSLWPQMGFHLPWVL